FRFFSEITGSVRCVTVRLEQRRAARAERAVENHFDGALGKMVIERVDRRVFFQETFGVFTGTVDAVYESNLGGAVGIDLLNKIDVPLRIRRHSVSEMASGILNLAPAEIDLAF